MVGFVFSPLIRYSVIIQCWNYCFDTFKLLLKYIIYLEGTAMHTFLLVGIGRSFGLFFVQFLAVYNTNSSMMSIILGLQTIVMSISGKFLFDHCIYQNCSHGVVFFLSFLFIAFSIAFAYSPLWLGMGIIFLLSSKRNNRFKEIQELCRTIELRQLFF